VQPTIFPFTQVFTRFRCSRFVDWKEKDKNMAAKTFIKKADRMQGRRFYFLTLPMQYRP
jgi:hypothetical protein